MGFRYDGVAWDGQSWVASDAMEALGREVGSVTPRPTSSDGTVASERHDASSPTSDHTPKPATGTGTVRAIDITVSAEQGTAWGEHLRQSKDPRLKYVIHAKRIFTYYEKNGVPPFTWRPYSGSNPHTNHIHVSMLRIADKDASPWGIANVTIEGDVLVTVEQLQETLVSAGYDLGAFGPNGDGVDGDYGALTQAAWTAMMFAAWESANSGTAGAKGDTGPAGPAGAKGDTGADGPQGQIGDTGTPGADGIKGRDGNYTVVVKGEIV